MSFLAKLKYVDGAILGKPFNKRKLTSMDANIKAKSKKYEEMWPKQRSRGEKTGLGWSTTRKKNVMTCSTCVCAMVHSTLQSNSIQLTCTSYYMTNIYNQNPKSTKSILVNGCINFGNLFMLLKNMPEKSTPIKNSSIFFRSGRNDFGPMKCVFQ